MLLYVGLELDTQDVILGLHMARTRACVWRLGQQRSAMMESRNMYGSCDCYFSGNPCYFYYLPLAFDLFEAFPLLGIPKPLFCDLSLLTAFMCVEEALFYQKQHHADPG
jgi:hypothetical protein